MLANLSINHYICGNSISFPKFARAVSEAGIMSVGITRQAIFEMGIADLKRCLDDYGLTVSSVNSAGFFVGDQNDGLNYSNEELIDFAATLNAEALCVIVGGLGGNFVGLDEAHNIVRAGIRKLSEQAAKAGVILGLEPIFPGDIFSKGCVNTLSQALELVEPFYNAKLTVDLYHSWWEANLQECFKKHTEKIVLLQICNLKVEDGVVIGRDLISKGMLNLSSLVPSLLTNKFNGKIELELFERDLRGCDPLDIIKRFPLDFDALV